MVTSWNLFPRAPSRAACLHLAGGLSREHGQVRAQIARIFRGDLMLELQSRLRVTSLQQTKLVQHRGEAVTPGNRGGASVGVQLHLPGKQ